MITTTDMDDKSDLKRLAIEKAQEYLGRTDIHEDEASEKMKAFFDQHYQPNWHCVIGKNFYCSFSHEAKTCIFFYIGQIAVLLYKLG